MVSLTWMLLMFQICPVAADFNSERCNTTEDRLYIVVESSSNIAVNVKRIKHFVQFFLSKRDNSSKIPITVIEPQKQQVLILSTVNSTKEILDDLDRLDNLIYVNTSNTMNISKLFEAVSYTKEIVQYDNARDVEKKSFLIAWFTYCNGDGQTMIDLFISNPIYFGEKQLILFLIDRSKLKHILNSKGGSVLSIFIDNNDDFSNGNKIDVDVCNECPFGWISFRNFYDPNIFSCYKIVDSSTKLSWFGATKLCSKLSSTLPILETKEELQFLISLNLNDYTQSYHAGNTFLHLGLTQKNIKPGTFQWTNGSPYILRNSIENNKANEKCLALSHSIRNEEKHESIGENRSVTLEMLDCTDNITEIVMCEMHTNRIFKKYLNFSPGWKTAENKMMSLNKEFSFDKSTGEMCSIVNKKLDIEQSVLDEFKLLLFDCEDGLQFIVYSKVCNNVKDCENGRDEDCGDMFSDLCDQIEFFCINPNANELFAITQAISIYGKCNFIQDCPDNSDEEGCDECMERRCSDGTCVPRDWLSHDGENCILYNDSNGTIFINITVEHTHAPRKLDYEIVYCVENTSPNQIRNTSGLMGAYEWAPKCIFLKGRGGQSIGCTDMSHLQGCEYFECPEYFIKCFNSYCIPSYLAMDGLQDCPYGEDEMNYFYKNGTFVCNSKERNDMFIHPDQVCDGAAQCPEGDDELNCNVTCPFGFKCFGSAVMVDDHQRVLELKSLRMFDIQTKFLNLSGLDLSQLNELYILPNLLTLDASNCNLQTLDFILCKSISLPLFQIDLSHNKLLDNNINFDESGLNFENMHYLKLTGNIRLTYLPQYLIASNKLYQLDLSFTQILSLGQDFPDQKSLRYLNVANSKIKSLDTLDGSRTLEFLDIRNTAVSDSGVVSLLSSLTITSALYTDNFKYCCPQVVGHGIPKHVCNAPFDGISSCEDLIGDVLKRSLLGLVAVISLLGNIFVLAFRISYELGVVKKAYVIFVTNLGIADLIMGIYLTIMASVDIYYRDKYVLHETEWRDSMLCRISGFLSTLSSETSTFFVVLITLDRFLVIRFPFGEYRLKKLLIILSVVTSWVIGFSLALIPIVYPQWKIYSSNGMCLGLPFTTGRQEGWQYSAGLFIVFNFILFVFIAFGQFLIFLSMSRQRIVMNTVKFSRQEQDINVAKQLSIVALSNFLCWFIICVTGLMSLNGHAVSPDTYAWIVIFVLPLNTALNPMIYIIPAVYKKWIEFKRGKFS